MLYGCREGDPVTDHIMCNYPLRISCAQSNKVLCVDQKGKDGLCGEAPVIRSYFHMTKTVTHTQIHVYLQDGNAMLWDLNEGKHLYTLNGGEVINTLVFSPNRYWLCAATGQDMGESTLHVQNLSTSRLFTRSPPPLPPSLPPCIHLFYHRTLRANLW